MKHVLQYKEGCVTFKIVKKAATIKRFEYSVNAKKQYQGFEKIYEFDETTN